MTTRTSDDEFRARCEAIRQQVSLSALAGRSIKLRRAGREWKACCPFHSDRTPSFTIYADDSRFMCFGCGTEGDAIDFVMKLHGVRLLDALTMLGSDSVPAVRLTLPVSAPECDRAAEAAAIWSAARDAAGTTAEAYLRSRGITGRVPASVRFAMLTLGRRAAMPTLVAAVSALDGSVHGVQRTFLSADPIGKAALPEGKAKFSLGRVRGGAIRLGPAAASLIVTEGLEDGLSLLQQLGRPVWVAAGASMLPAMQLPAVTRSLIIGADNDEAGERAAQAAAETFSASGRAVRILRPQPKYKDFNAELVDHRR